jgi:hypothetical protein
MKTEYKDKRTQEPSGSPVNLDAGIGEHMTIADRIAGTPVHNDMVIICRNVLLGAPPIEGYVRRWRVDFHRMPRRLQ